MNYNLTTEGKIDDARDAFCIRAPFDVSTRMFTNSSKTHISLEELAKSRILNGEYHSFSKEGSYVKEGVLYLPARIAEKPSIVLARESFILRNPKLATSQHRKYKIVTYEGTKEQARSILESAKKKGNKYLLLNDTSPIPTKRFGEDERTVWMFGKTAQAYGNFLEQFFHGQEFKIPLHFSDTEKIDEIDLPHINQLWMCALDEVSVIFGKIENLTSFHLARGVQSIQ